MHTHIISVTFKQQQQQKPKQNKNQNVDLCEQSSTF